MIMVRPNFISITALIKHVVDYELFIHLYIRYEKLTIELFEKILITL